MTPKIPPTHKTTNPKHREDFVYVEKDKKYPMLFFLHVAGGRGLDNKGQLLDANSITAFKSHRLFSNYDSYVFAGQVPEGERWVNVDWSSSAHQMPVISNSLKNIF